jgi:peptide/nickel transport system substrate-binding protein
MGVERSLPELDSRCAAAKTSTVNLRQRAAGIVVLVLGAAGSAAVVASSPEASPTWTLRVAQTGTSSAIGSIDPAQAVGFTAPQILWSTCAFLYDYRDREAPSGSVLVPEVAAGFPSLRRDGRNYRYTIHVRAGFRFDDGRPVTARSYVHAIHRDLAPGVQPSQGPVVLKDLVSATSHGDTIVVTMDRPAADLPAMLSSTLFCAVPAGLPDRPTQTAPMAGPYYIASATAGEIVLKRNPYYRGRRPRNPAEIDWSFGVPGDAIPLEVERGDSDYGVVSPRSTASIAARYGINKSQFFVAPGYQVLCLALNTTRPLFAGNPQLRRAVNFAVDRHALAAAFGSYVGRRTDQFLPFAMPGFVAANLYPLRGPDLEKARALARGHTRNGTAVMFVRSDASSAYDRAEIVQYDLKQIGIDVTIQPWSPDQAGLLATRGAPFDIADRGCGDIAPYFDPYALLDLPFDGSLIRSADNTNLSYIDDAGIDHELHAAARLTGFARYRAYGRLDVAITRVAAPAVPYAMFNHFAFVSARIGCVKLNPIYGASLGALCLKGS